MRRYPPALAVLASLALSAHAQEGEAPPAPEAPPAVTPQPDVVPNPPSDQPLDPSSDPSIMLGRRVAADMAARSVIPTVVIVPDPASYAEAIAHWTPETIFPVLIDDGSWASQEDIARFVRGFRAEAVVRWEAGPDAVRARGPMRARRAVPNARAMSLAALARSWGADPNAEDPGAAILARWKELGHEPPGVVVVDDRDPAWTAGLALAAGRGQPMGWTSLPKRAIDASLAIPEIEQLASGIQQFMTGTGLPWQGLGDTLETVTICAALPARIQTGPQEFAATTDRIGRLDAQRRFGWAGQIFGTEPEAAYRAMCSLFLRQHSAWLFDGYGSGEPWSQWDCTAAAGILESAGLFVMVDDEPRNTLRDFKLRAERPIRADLILMNSSGNRGWFDLAGSRAQVGDIPTLDAPAAMHLVHSWSAVAPGRRETVGGRWLERGVYAYVGSVHEPFLQAFVPTPILATRLTEHAVLGAAVRAPGAPIWRIAVLADPLITFCPDSPRSSAPLPLEGARSLSDSMKAAATEGRFAQAVSDLALLGRDSDAARLVKAILRDKPEALDGDLARASIYPLFRTGMDDEFLQAYAALPAELAADGAAVDTLWHAGRRVAREGGRYRQAAITLMAAHMREDQKVNDAAELQQISGRP